MTKAIRTKGLRTAVLAAGLALTPIASMSPQQATTVKPKHHSVAKGAVVGGVAGHVLLKKHHGALVGAVAGAAVQHHRNKKAAKQP